MLLNSYTTYLDASCGLSLPLQYLLALLSLGPIVQGKIAVYGIS